MEGWSDTEVLWEWKTSICLVLSCLVETLCTAVIWSTSLFGCDKFNQYLMSRTSCWLVSLMSLCDMMT